MNDTPENLPFDVHYFRKQGSHQAASVKEIFNDIYRRNHWNGQVSVSGPGSDLEQTRRLREILPAFVAEWHISSVLDIPCGDFYWMQQVQWPTQVRYTGADIVPELIEHHQRHYANTVRTFRVLDLLEDELPVHDLVFCRDCLVHLSNR